MAGKRPLLLLRVLAELGKGKLRVVEPVPQNIDTLIHELLHRLYPEWSENYVRNRTSFLMKRLSTDEVAVIHDEYNKRKKGRR